MFLINSRTPLVTATPASITEQVGTPAGAPLLPKLRGQFAEFLSRSSLKRLGILYPPTRVGLRYGHPASSLRGFSREHGIGQFGLPEGFPPHHLSALNGKADLPTFPAYRLEPGHPSPGWTYPSPSPLRSNAYWVVREY